MSEFSKELLEWYTHQGRKLPWRGSLDPYAVWISEIMLQQTRVEAVIPFFERWMKRFPSIRELAVASEQEALAVWEGLGYYSRARYLHAGACYIVNHFDGRLPSDEASLRQIKGLGDYTIGAILSFAFQQVYQP